MSGPQVNDLWPASRPALIALRRTEAGTNAGNARGSEHRRCSEPHHLTPAVLDLSMAPRLSGTDQQRLEPLSETAQL